MSKEQIPQLASDFALDKQMIDCFCSFPTEKTSEQSVIPLFIEFSCVNTASLANNHTIVSNFFEIGV